MKAETLLNKIPKAQVDYIKVTKKDLKKAMIQFAKIHVQAALEAASKLEETNGTAGYKVYPEAILNSYPLDNIK